MRAPLVAVLAALLALPPLASGQAELERVFIVQDVRMEGDVLVVTVHNAYFTVYSVIASLTVDGTLLAPERKLDTWSAQATRDLRFGGVDGSSATLTLRYERPDDRHTSETFPLKVPTSPARVVVTDAALDGRTVVVALENVGERASGPVTVSLADPTQGRLGDPLQRQLDGLAPAGKGEARFEVTERLATVRVHVEHDGRETDTDVTLRAPKPPEVEVVDARVHEGRANLTLRNVGGAPTGPVRVALEDASGLRIGSPLSRTVGDIAVGAEANVSFTVPASTDEATVVLEYDDREDTLAVRLDPAGDGGAPLELTTDLPSREGEPGGAVSYSLTLANEGSERLASLHAAGLPQGYTARFSIGGSAASDVLLPADGSRTVVATVTLPEGAGRDAGTSLPFEVRAVAGEEEAVASLTLSVRGAGKLELQGQNWFTSLAPGGTQSVTVTLRNTGSAALHDVTPDATRPTGWRVSFDPATLDKLDPGEARSVKVTVEPPPDVGSGRYVLDVTAASSDVSARPRSLSVEIVEESSSSLGWLVGAGLAGLVAVALVVKLRRR